MTFSNAAVSKNVSVPGIDTITILHSSYVIFGLLIFAIEINVLSNGQL